jgi:hypothetical protein
VCVCACVCVCVCVYVLSASHCDTLRFDQVYSVFVLSTVCSLLFAICRLLSAVYRLHRTVTLCPSTRRTLCLYAYVCMYACVCVLFPQSPQAPTLSLLPSLSPCFVPPRCPPSCKRPALPWYYLPHRTSTIFQVTLLNRRQSD